MRMLILSLAMMLSAEAEAACGTRGGPGYRGPNGRCVGWADIGRTCGSPPEQRCIAEYSNPNAGVAAYFGSRAIEAGAPVGSPARSGACPIKASRCPAGADSFRPRGGLKDGWPTSDRAAEGNPTAS